MCVCIHTRTHTVNMLKIIALYNHWIGKLYCLWIISQWSWFVNVYIVSILLGSLKVVWKWLVNVSYHCNNLFLHFYSSRARRRGQWWESRWTYQLIQTLGEKEGRGLGQLEARSWMLIEESEYEGSGKFYGANAWPVTGTPKVWGKSELSYLKTW